MPKGKMYRLLSYGPGLALFATFAHLGWELTHGGVRSHHLFAQNDLPAVSNWWGLLILPLLGWLASRTATARAEMDEGAAARAVAAFVGALLVGLALSLSFVAGYESLSSGLFLATMASGLVLPTYRGEYLFGFVLGMTFVIGSALPAVFASVAAALSAAVHFLVRPALSMLFRKLRA